MTKDETKVGNEAIARFMGWEHPEYRTFTYQTEWEHLMGAVLKINGLYKESDEDWRVMIGHNWCEIRRYHKGADMSFVDKSARFVRSGYSRDDLIDCVWATVRDFCVAYNQQQTEATVDA